MNKLLITFLVCVFSCASIFSQNIACNPSFEDTIVCPQGLVENLNCYVSGNLIQSEAFNRCDNSVPVNIYGYQNPFGSGDGYSGFYALNHPGFDPSAISGDLTVPIMTGDTVRYKFAVSLADSSMYASNNVGLRFSSIKRDIFSPAPMDSLCTGNLLACFHNDTIVQDQNGWTFLSGQFVSASTYLYFTIGAVMSGSFSDTVIVASGNPISYYYLDEVSIFVSPFRIVISEDSFCVNENDSIMMPVLANDPPGLSLLSITTPPLNGTAQIVGDSIEYIPNPGFFGMDELYYVACDPVVNICDTARVAICVNQQVNIKNPTQESLEYHHSTDMLGRTCERRGLRVDWFVKKGEFYHKKVYSE